MAGGEARLELRDGLPQVGDLVALGGLVLFELFGARIDLGDSAVGLARGGEAALQIRHCLTQLGDLVALGGLHRRELALQRVHRLGEVLGLAVLRGHRLLLRGLVGNRRSRDRPDRREPGCDRADLQALLEGDAPEGRAFRRRRRLGARRRDEWDQAAARGFWLCARRLDALRRRRIAFAGRRLDRFGS